MAKSYRPFQPAVFTSQSYSKMVPLRHPMVKAYPHRARDRVGGSPMHTSPLCVIPGEYVWPMAKPYWTFQPAVSTSHSYGKMVPPTTPYGKNIPTQGCLPPHLTRGGVRVCACVCGYVFTIGCRRGYHFTIAL